MLTGLIFLILPFSNRWAGRVGPFPYTLMILCLWVVFQINILFLIKLISLIMECLIIYLFVCLDILIQQDVFLLGESRYANSDSSWNLDIPGVTKESGIPQRRNGTSPLDIPFCNFGTRGRVTAAP